MYRELKVLRDVFTQVCKAKLQVALQDLQVAPGEMVSTEVLEKIIKQYLKYVGQELGIIDIHRHKRT